MKSDGRGHRSIAKQTMRWNLERFAGIFVGLLILLLCDSLITLNSLIKTFSARDMADVDTFLLTDRLPPTKFAIFTQIYTTTSLRKTFYLFYRQTDQ